MQNSSFLMQIVYQSFPSELLQKVSLERRQNDHPLPRLPCKAHHFQCKIHHFQYEIHLVEYKIHRFWYKIHRFWYEIHRFYHRLPARPVRPSRWMYLKSQNHRPFFNTKSWFFRGDSPFFLHFQRRKSGKIRRFYWNSQYCSVVDGRPNCITCVTSG